MKTISRTLSHYCCVRTRSSECRIVFNLEAVCVLSSVEGCIAHVH